MHSPLVISLVALALSIALHAFALRAFPRLGLLDFPERYGYTRPRIPYPTGVLCVVIFLLFYTALFADELKEYGVITSIIMLTLTAFIDDRMRLPFWQRLIVQCISFFVVFAAGSQIYTITHPLGGFIQLDAWNITLPFFGTLPVLSGAFTILWLGLTTNALNWFDGIPGQVSALSVVGFLLLGVLALERTEQPEVALLCFVLSGIALGSLCFDCPPARVLMGDTGSMFFGFMLGLVGVYQGGKVATAFVILAIPLFDAMFVTISRIARGTSPFKGGRDHLHHRLLALGWSARAIVLLTAATSATCGTIALFLSTTGKAIEILILMLLMIALERYASQKRVTSGT